MNFPNTKNTSFYEISFMDVVSNNVKVEIRKFDGFANINIDLGIGDISLFTHSVDEALAIVKALASAVVTDCTVTN